MTPAPFTPDAIAHIRASASKKSIGQIAADLRWDADRVKRVAKQFGIDVHGDASASVLPAPRYFPADPPRQDLKAFDASTSLEEMVERLPGLQAQLVDYLTAEGVDGKLIPTLRLVNLFGTSRAGLGVAVHVLRKKMRDTRWTIECVKYSGYRLVTQSGRVD